MTTPIRHILEGSLGEDTLGFEGLERAVSAGLPAILMRFRGSGDDRYLTSFVGTDAESLYLAQPCHEHTRDVPELLAGDPIGLSFRVEAEKYEFSTVVTGAGVRHQSDAAAVVAVKKPRSAQIMQRRLYERVSPPRHERVAVSFRLQRRRPPVAGQGSDARCPVSSDRGTLKDLSAGGLRLQTPRRSPLSVGRNVTCTLRVAGGQPLEVAARLRSVLPNSDGTWSLGFEFIGGESGSADLCRSARLAAITSQFRRAQAEFS